VNNLAEKKLQEAYRRILGDHFPDSMRIVFGEDENEQTLRYEKVGWNIEGEVKGLRYGENPGQEAAMYKLVNGNLALGDVKTIQPGKWLASDVQLLQSGKHPGKINITDADNALNILRYFSDEPIVSIMKHNNPCGAAIGRDLLDAYQKANNADRVAAFGGVIALNKPVNGNVADAISKNYAEVIVAPGYEQEALDIFAKKKDLRVMKIENMNRLKDWSGEVVVDLKSLIDGGIIAQTSFVPKARTVEDIKGLPLGFHNYKGNRYEIKRRPTETEYRDMWFGWLVETGITSNSVIYVKDGVTVGIGVGEQDRVGSAKSARDKAYEKLKDRLCFERLNVPSNDLELMREKDKLTIDQRTGMAEIEEVVKESRGGLKNATAVSDGFFPFRDGVDVGFREGVRSIIQPGGSIRDYEVIEACNENDATMVFTDQRCFKH
jgi:phosphoribosylaminoimidazolecarboxamide formyltransferase/IMP cyclohydrolase